VTDLAGHPDETAIEAILAAARVFAVRDIVTVLDRAVEDRGLDRAVDEVVLPAMRRIGELWATGLAGVAEEHLATTATYVWLGKVNADIPPPTLGPPVVLASGPLDLHTLSMDCMAAILLRRGLDCRNFGARTPTVAVVTAVRRLTPAAVILVAHTARTRAAALQTLQAVSGCGTTTQIYYAGGAFSSAAHRRGVPGQFLGHQLGAAADLVSAATASRSGAGASVR
jgi:methanogenic corrinoid protein MtbC1